MKYVARLIITLEVFEVIYLVQKHLFSKIGVNDVIYIHIVLERFYASLPFR